MIETLTFQKEKLQDIYDEMLPIFIAHYHEIAHYKDIRLEPDVEEYFSLEDKGYLHTYTARESGELVGYAVFLIKKALHYKSSKQAWQDILYIKKENRGFGKHFILWCDAQLADMGVQVVHQHIKFAHDWSLLLEKLGYVKQDILMSKRLDGG